MKKLIVFDLDGTLAESKAAIDKDMVTILNALLDVAKVADNIIDLGPDGGQAGGQILVTGTPEVVAKEKTSYTGQFLKTVLKGN